MTDSRARAVDGAEGVIGFAGITLGVIPLAARLIAGEHTGPFRWLFGAPDGAMAYVAPGLVIAVAIMLIAVLERVKRRG